MNHPRLTSALVTAAMAAAAVATFAAAPAGDEDCLRVVDGLDVQTATVVDLQAAMDAGTTSSQRLTEHALRRIGLYDDVLNAVRSLAPDALDQAAALDAERGASGPRSPLHGLTVLLKDNVGTTDLPTTAGSIALADNVPAAEATITTRLRDAGAIVLGKANLSEFANWVSLSMPNGYSSLGGQVTSPYRFGADPLGSSTGSGVAATMAFSAVAIGTETSGSIISPATVHSLVGVKPTVGLVSRAGIIPLAETFDTAGPMARTVVDAAATLAVIAGSDDADAATADAPAVPDYLAALDDTALQGARIGVRQGDLDAGGPFGDALAVMVEQGAELVSIDEPLPTAASGSILELGAIFNEFKTGLNAYLADQAGDAVEVASLADIIAFNEQHPDRVQYGQNLLELSDAQSGTDVDPVMLATRTAAVTASQAWIDGVMAGLELDAIAAPDFDQVNLAAAAGYPNVTVPVGYEGQTPHGLSLISTAWDEADLLAFAFDVEQAMQARIAPTVLNPDLPYCTDVTAQDGYGVVAEDDFADSPAG